MAQDLASFGRDQGKGEREIVPLIEAVAERVGRVRCLYLYPSDLTDQLRSWFGYTDFRPGQRDACEATLAGRDVLAIMPTGSGKSLCYQLPALVDDTDNRVETAYTGWPDRLYVIDYDGRIAFKSEAGPFGFEPKDVAAALKRLVPASTPPS